MKCILLVTTALALAGCSYYQAKSGQNRQDETGVTDFAWLQANLFQPDCVSCHSSGLNLTSFASMQNSTGAVVAGDPEKSRVFAAIEAGRMPPSGSLSQPEALTVLRCWIEAGATEDSAVCTVDPSPPSAGEDAGDEEDNPPPAQSDGDDSGAWQDGSVDDNGRDDDHGDDDHGKGDDDDGRDDDGGGDDDSDGEDGGTGTGDDNGGDDTSGDDGGDPAPTVDFAEIDANVFSPHCVSCHNTDRPRGGLSVSSYDEVLASGFVVAGDAVGSLLFEAIDTDYMPFGAPLSDEQKALVRQWIEEGAQ